MQTARIHTACQARATMRGLGGSPRTVSPKRATVRVRALADTNLFVNLIASATAGAAVTAVVTATSEDGLDKGFDKLMTVEGGAPLAGAFLVDAIAHSIPGLNVLFNLASEPAGAAAGVAYMFSLVLSSAAVDPRRSPQRAPCWTPRRPRTREDLYACRSRTLCRRCSTSSTTRTT
jgi:hypothetical protein